MNLPFELVVYHLSKILLNIQERQPFNKLWRRIYRDVYCTLSSIQINKRLEWVIGRRFEGIPLSEFNLPCNRLTSHMIPDDKWVAQDLVFKLRCTLDVDFCKKLNNDEDLAGFEIWCIWRYLYNLIKLYIPIYLKYYQEHRYYPICRKLCDAFGGIEMIEKTYIF